MKILHIVPGFDLSGRSRVIHELCRGLAGGAWRCAVVSLAANPGYRPPDMEVMSLAKREGLDLGALWGLVRLARRFGATVLHTHGRGALVYGAFARRPSGARALVHTVHRSDGDPAAGRLWLRKRLLRAMDRVAAVSDAAGREFARCHGVPSARVRTIYNGIDLERFQARAQRSGPEGGPVLGTVANLSADKDTETLLRGFARVRGLWAGARLVIAGDGPAAAACRRLASDLGLTEAVAFLGFRADVPELLRTFDVFVHATRTEGLGVAILEAMAAGVPVAASAVGGIPEIVQDRVNGLLFPPGDPAALAAAVTDVLRQPEAAAQRAAAARRRVAERFTVQAMCAAYERLYGEVAGTA